MTDRIANPKEAGAQKCVKSVYTSDWFFVYPGFLDASDFFVLAKISSNFMLSDMVL